MSLIPLCGKAISGGGANEMRDLQTRRDPAGHRNDRLLTSRGDPGDSQYAGEICQNCGEVYLTYLSPEVVQELLAKAEDALRAGMMVDVREFLPAAA
jgi:hypothetical protein